MKKLLIWLLAIVILAGVGFGGYWLGCNRGEVESDEKVVVDEKVPEETVETQKEEAEVLFPQGEWLGITDIETKGGKCILKGVVQKDYLLTEEEVAALRADEKITLKGEELSFVAVDGDYYVWQPAESGRYGIAKEKNGTWIVVEQSSGCIVRSTGTYFEIEVDANLPCTTAYFDEEQQIKTVKDMAESEYYRYYDSWNIRIKNGEFVELFGGANN